MKYEESGILDSTGNVERVMPFNDTNRKLWCCCDSRFTRRTTWLKRTSTRAISRSGDYSTAGSRKGLSVSRASSRALFLLSRSPSCSRSTSHLPCSIALLRSAWQSSRDRSPGSRLRWSWQRDRNARARCPLRCLWVLLSLNRFGRQRDANVPTGFPHGPDHDALASRRRRLPWRLHATHNPVCRCGGRRRQWSSAVEPPCSPAQRDREMRESRKRDPSVAPLARRIQTRTRRAGIVPLAQTQSRQARGQWEVAELFFYAESSDSLVLPSFPRWVWFWDCGDPQEAKNLAGEMLSAWFRSV